MHPFFSNANKPETVGTCRSDPGAKKEVHFGVQGYPQVMRIQQQHKVS